MPAPVESPSSSQSEMTDRSDPRSCGCRAGNIVAAATPAAAIAVLIVIYIASPVFYVNHILEYQHRESQAVEMVTFLAASVAAAMLFLAASRLWRIGAAALPAFGVDPNDLRGPAALRGRGGAIIVAVVALATLFFAGEEVNWGQNFFNWGVPEYEKGTGFAGPEVNLHNSFEVVSVQSLGSAFLLGVFFGLPLMWLGRHRLTMIGDWGPAIPTWPVVAAMLTVQLWGLVKPLYRAIHPDAGWESTADYLDLLAQVRGDSPVEIDSALYHYVGFFDQVKEQKEMLVAIVLLLYSIYLNGLARRLASGSGRSFAETG